VSNTEKVLGYERPVSLGGRPYDDPDVVTVRWFGTACFEVAVGDRVVLLDQHYERSVRNRSLGFDATDVVRADVLLVGHPHPDHVSDTRQVSLQTKAPAVIAPRGADFLLRSGLGNELIVPVTGLGQGDKLNFGDISVLALHGLHGNAHLSPDVAEAVADLQRARGVLDDLLLDPVTPEEFHEAEEIFARGILVPEVLTEETITYVIEIDGFKIVFRDSGGELTDEEVKYFGANPGCDLAFVSINGRPHWNQDVEDVFLPTVRLFDPKVLVPAHHDALFGAIPGRGRIDRLFIDVATEVLKERVHAEFPSVVTVQPGLVEPIYLNRKTGEVALGEKQVLAVRS
jgi:L-ascorbate metabolism protein UlaG (beta-lactamase superfamily)